MNKHNEYMRLAIEKTREGILKGQTPFGCCIVKNNEVISCEHNTVWQNTDITAHAEITAIRKACKKLDTIDLSGCVLYSTTEPCPMCFSAIHWAKIDTIYFGASIDDAANAGFNELHISNETMIIEGKSNIKIYPNILKDECISLFKEWKELGKSKKY